MTRVEFINAIAEEANISKKDAKLVWEAAQNVVLKQMKEHEEVKIFEGLTLASRMTNPRKGRNPQTGEEMMIGGGIVPKVKFGKAFRDIVK